MDFNKSSSNISIVVVATWQHQQKKMLFCYCCCSNNHWKSLSFHHSFSLFFLLNSMYTYGTDAEQNICFCYSCGNQKKKNLQRIIGSQFKCPNITMNSATSFFRAYQNKATKKKQLSCLQDQTINKGKKEYDFILFIQNKFIFFSS